jgi:hypothetical protein
VNASLDLRYIGEFKDKFTVAAKEARTALRKTMRTDLNWVVTEQTERMVNSDNTVGQHGGKP